MIKSKKKKIEVSPSDVESFISVTGVSEEVAQRQLRATNGDLLLAINMHMDGKVVEEDSETDEDNIEVGSTTGSKKDRGQTKPTSRSSSCNNGAMEGPSCSVSYNDDELRAPIAPVTARLLEPTHSLDWDEPVRHRFTAFDSLRNFDVEATRQEEMLECPSRTRKRKTLEDLFRPPIHLMFQGGFLQARDAATAKQKWLLVNIQNVREFQCQVLNRDVWSDSVIESVIREQFVFWQVTSDSMEGKRFMQFYKLHSWPYVGIIDPRTGECMSEYNHISQESFCDVLLTFLSANPWDRLELPLKIPRLASVATSNVACSNDTASANQAEAATSILDATEDQQLEMALAASLKEATAASSSTSDAAATPSDGNDEPNTAEDEDNDDSPSSSPFSSPPNLPVPVDDSAPKLNIMLRFPDGKREEACFSSSAPIMVLQQHVASRGFPTADYELVTHFPRRNLSELKPNTPLESASLQTRDTVFVQARS